MTLVFRSNNIATRAISYADGLNGPRDFSLFADFSRNSIVTQIGGVRTEESFDDVFTFTRSSPGEYIDASGEPIVAEANEPRFSYVNGIRGLLMEQERINYARNSDAPATQTFTVP